ncbi:hypothetical protein PG991_003575 [Apiospora marii]|uniref:Uncharacterized protein n=1 Tax=Apiospora marii TaxID=335849 RepID=A0ABR1S5K0_9PEZI
MFCGPLLGDNHIQVDTLGVMNTTAATIFFFSGSIFASCVQEPVPSSTALPASPIICVDTAKTSRNGRHDQTGFLDEGFGREQGERLADAEPLTNTPKRKRDLVLGRRRWLIKGCIIRVEYSEKPTGDAIRQICEHVASNAQDPNCPAVVARRGTGHTFSGLRKRSDMETIDGQMFSIAAIAEAPRRRPCSGHLYDDPQVRRAQGPRRYDTEGGDAIGTRVCRSHVEHDFKPPPPRRAGHWPSDIMDALFSMTRESSKTHSCRACPRCAIDARYGSGSLAFRDFLIAPHDSVNFEAALDADGPIRMQLPDLTSTGASISVPGVSPSPAIGQELHDDDGDNGDEGRANGQDPVQEPSRTVLMVLRVESKGPGRRLALVRPKGAQIRQQNTMTAQICKPVPHGTRRAGSFAAAPGTRYSVDGLIVSLIPSNARRKFAHTRAHEVREDVGGDEGFVTEKQGI